MADLPYGSGTQLWSTISDKPFQKSSLCEFFTYLYPKVH